MTVTLHKRLFQTVLELCRSESTADLLNVQPHLEVIQNLTMGSSCDQEASVHVRLNIGL